MIEIEPFNEHIMSVKTASPLGDQAMMWVYAYHVGDALFDAGCANAIEELRAYATEHPVNRVFVTHSHEDHLGGCKAFSPEARIFAGPATTQALKEPIALNQFFQFVWGQAEPLEEVELIPETFLVGDFHFEVVDLSGHCEEMIGFWEPNQGWLFASDAVPLPSQKQIAMPEENIPKMIRRMKEIQKLELKVLFDGHRGPVSNPQTHIQTRIDFLESLQQRVRNLSQEGKTIQEIKEILNVPEPWYLANTEGRFGVEYVIRSLLEDSAD